MEKYEAQIVLIREILGLSAIHDPVEAVRVLYESGREAMERQRGPSRDDRDSGVSGILAAAGYPFGQQIYLCKGSLALGTGCGHCQRCLKERAEMPKRPVAT